MPEEVFRKVQDDARGRMAWREATASNLSIQREVLGAGHVIQAAHQKIALERDTVMVFADDEPLANWAHPCRYLLYSAEEGELYSEVAASFPPYLLKAPDTYELYHEPVRHIEEALWSIRPRDLRVAWRYPVGDRYAVLFSGASNNRHVNDLEFLYRTLIDVYNFDRENIYVLNYDGTLDYDGWPRPVGDWPGDSTAYRMPINAAGTRTEFEAVIDDLKGRLNSDDLLLIHTNNHGSHDGSQSCLCAYSSTYPYWSAYWASDFAGKLGELPQFRCLIVMMEQCHAGGFNADIIASSPADRTSVASACEELESSIGGWYFDPFARDWIAAVAGADPYGSALAYDPDTDGNGCISAAEAFDYADTVKDPFDTPVFDASPADAGDCHLGQIYSELEAVIPKLYYEVVWRRIWPYRERMVDPEFYARVHMELVPRLREVEEIAGQRRKELGEELAPRIEEVVKEVFG